MMTMAACTLHRIEHPLLVVKLSTAAPSCCVARPFPAASTPCRPPSCRTPSWLPLRSDRPCQTMLHARSTPTCQTRGRGVQKGQRTHRPCDVCAGIVHVQTAGTLQAGRRAWPGCSEGTQPRRPVAAQLATQPRLKLPLQLGQHAGLGVACTTRGRRVGAVVHRGQCRPGLRLTEGFDLGYQLRQQQQQQL